MTGLTMSKRATLQKIARDPGRWTPAQLKALRTCEALRRAGLLVGDYPLTWNDGRDRPLFPTDKGRALLASEVGHG